MRRRGRNKEPQETAQPASTQAAAGGGANAEELVAQDRALEERIGSQNFDAARLLARCQHDSDVS
jgi:hypothetical protein